MLPQEEEGAPTPSPEEEQLAPAEFQLSNISTNPSEVEPGETVTISVGVANVGEETGNYDVKLKIDGSVADTESITLDGGESKSILFEIQKDTEKSYSVKIGDLSGNFVVKKPAKADIEILSTYSYIDSVGYPTVVGEVKNKGTKNASFVKIVATFYDSSEDVIGSEFTYTQLDIVKADQKSPFKTSLLEDVSFDSVETQVQWDTTDSEPYDDYEILSHSGKLSDIGYYEVTGEIKNVGDKEREFNKIVGTFYDSNGRVVASEFTYTKIETLSPGQKSPFTITVINEDISRMITDYSLVAQS